MLEDRLYFTIRDLADLEVRLLKLKVGDSHCHRPVLLAALLELTPENAQFVSIDVTDSVSTGGELFFAFDILSDFFPFGGARLWDGFIFFVAFTPATSNEPWALPLSRGSHGTARR